MAKNKDNEMKITLTTTQIEEAIEDYVLKLLQDDGWSAEVLLCAEPDIVIKCSK